MEISAEALASRMRETLACLGRGESLTITRDPHSERCRSFALAQSAASAPPANTASDSASRAERRLGATKRTPTSSARSLASTR